MAFAVNRGRWLLREEYRTFFKYAGVVLFPEIETKVYAGLRMTCMRYTIASAMRIERIKRSHRV